MSTMQVIHFKKGGGKAADCLEVQSIPKPDPKPDDLLVKIEASAVNPVDTKIRQGEFPANDVTGFDAAGVVVQVGSNVKPFKPGDQVYYAGVLGRQGSMAQYNLIDYRFAALKPKKLDWVTAASIPLVSLTAWELFDEHWGLQQNDPSGKQAKKSIIIINGAGGVGSMGTQLARKVFKFGKVVVTASRAETVKHAKEMGATDVISHHEPLKPQLEKIGLAGGVNYIMICYDTNAYMETAVDIAAPAAKIGSIVEIAEPLGGLHVPEAFQKSLSFQWEFMLGKGALEYDQESQGEILRKVAQLYDDGVLIPFVSEQYPLSVPNLIKAHEKLESGKTIGKIAFKVGDDIA